MDTNDSDLVVIGSGPGGYVAAIRAAQLGMRAVVVEKDPLPGGTCLHRGCIPTKAMLHTASLYEEISAASKVGVVVGEGVRVDPEGAREYRLAVVDKNARGISYLFRKNGVELRRGRGRLLAPGVVEVESPESTETLRARNVLIATGSVPKELPALATDGERVLNSDQVLELDYIPRSLGVVGGGAVGAEFASIYASFGSQVTLIEMLDHLLPGEDREVCAELERCFKRRKITVATGTSVRGVERLPAGLEVTVAGAGGSSSRLECEVLVLAVGRQPVIAGLGLEESGVEIEADCIKVDSWMRTTAPGIYAIGDVVKTPWLAHVASAEGILAVEHMAGVDARPIDYDRVPSCTYCSPEVASVGLTEIEARARGFAVECGKFPFSASGKAAILGHTEGFVKVVRESRYDELLGVHIVGAHATDLIAEACVALQVESTTEELFRTMHAHPTLSEAVAEAAQAAVGRPLHS